MKKHTKYTLISFILLIAFLPPGFSQGILYYKMGISVYYLPSCATQSELYSKEKNSIKHTAKKRGWKFCRDQSKTTLKKDDQIEKLILSIDSLYKLKSFVLKVPQPVIDSMKTSDPWKQHEVTRDDVNRFFKNGNTVILHLDSVKHDIMEGVIIDGCAFNFNLSLKTNASDTIKYSFNGNFMDDVYTVNIKNWLPLYIAYHQHPFFPSISLVKEYFSNERLQSVLFRFIYWNKKK